MKIKRIGVDLAKNVYQLHGVDGHDKCVLQRRLKRDHWLKGLFEKAEPGCEIGMEACTGSHHWARLLQGKGYKVKLIAPQFVKPYVKSNKNDAKDAEAICEAMSRPSMRFVPVKTVDQQDIQAMHRIRSELVCHRTAKGNQIRGLVSEYGLVAPKLMASLRRAIPEWLEDGDNGLTDRFRGLLNGLWGQYERDPASLTKNVAVGVCLAGYPPEPGEQPLTGSITEIAEQLDGFLNAGVDHLVVHLTPNTREGIEQFSRILSQLK